jgi:hypothetical protein
MDCASITPFQNRLTSVGKWLKAENQGIKRFLTFALPLRPAQVWWISSEN